MDYTGIVKRKIDIGEYNISSMAEYLGISRPTIYKRLVASDWRKGEKELIKRLG